jgi:hypothetical protein
MAEELRLRAYYYHFQPTGCEPIDRVLEAVAIAGKAYHNTSEWANDDVWDGGPSYAERIQIAANKAAEFLKENN